MTSANCEKRLKDMSTEGHQKLSVLLEPLDPLGKDYRLLADKMGYTNDYIKYLGSKNEPVKTLITKYEKGDRKIAELVSLLNDMERYDVVEELQKYIGRFCLCLYSSNFCRLLFIFAMSCLELMIITEKLQKLLPLSLLDLAVFLYVTVRGPQFGRGRWCYVWVAKCCI